MIKINQVVKTYGAQRALDQVSLEVEAGECLVLIGPSGCGKSTLLKSLNRLVSIDEGNIVVLDQAIEDWELKELRRKMGYCIQHVGLFPHLSVQENIAVLLRVMKRPEAEITARVEYLLQLTQLPLSYKEKKPHQLSGGEAQRVGVCRALAADPPILLMDEPFGALDPLTRTSVQKAFRDIQQRLKKTVVFVTHDLEEAIQLGDRIALMNEGRVIHIAPPHQLNLNPQVFTQSFIGKEYLLYLLQRYSLADLNLTPSAPASKLVDLSLSSTLQEALALVLSHSQHDLVFKDAEAHYTINYTVLQAFIEGIQRV